MDVRLRPEQWGLLAILAAGVILLAFQLGQDWSLPDFDPEPAGSPGSEKSPDSPPQGGGEETGSPPSQAPPGADSGSLPQVAAAPQDAPLLRLRMEPAAVAATEPSVAFVSLERATRAVKVSFDVAYDPAQMSPEPSAWSAMFALGGDNGLPEVSVDSPAPGRLKVQVTRRGGDPSLNATGDLCVIQFITQQRGRAAVRITRAEVLADEGDPVAASGSEAQLQIN